MTKSGGEFEENPFISRESPPGPTRRGRCQLHFKFSRCLSSASVSLDLLVCLPIKSTGDQFNVQLTNKQEISDQNLTIARGDYPIKRNLILEQVLQLRFEQTSKTADLDRARETSFGWFRHLNSLYISPDEDDRLLKGIH